MIYMLDPLQQHLTHLLPTWYPVSQLACVQAVKIFSAGLLCDVVLHAMAAALNYQRSLSFCAC